MTEIQYNDCTIPLDTVEVVKLRQASGRILGWMLLLAVPVMVVAFVLTELLAPNNIHLVVEIAGIIMVLVWIGAITKRDKYELTINVRTGDKELLISMRGTIYPNCLFLVLKSLVAKRDQGVSPKAPIKTGRE